MNEKNGDTMQDLLRYKQMYLRMVRAAMDAEQIMHKAMCECEEIFLSEASEDNRTSNQ